MATEKYRNIVDCIKVHAREVPERLAIVAEAGSITYGQLVPKVDRLARRLLEMGIKKGDIVGVLSYPRIDAYELHLALISIGAIWLGINPKYKYPEMEYITADARPVALFFVSEQGDRKYKDDIFKLKSVVDSVKNLVCFDRAHSWDNILRGPVGRRRCAGGYHHTAQRRRRCGDDRLYVRVVREAKRMHAAQQIDGASRTNPNPGL